MHQQGGRIRAGGHLQAALLAAQPGQQHGAVKERNGVFVLRQAPCVDVLRHQDADGVAVLPFAAQGGKAGSGSVAPFLRAVHGNHCLAVHPPRDAQVQRERGRCFHLHAQDFGAAIRVMRIFRRVFMDVLARARGAGEVEAAGERVAHHREGHGAAVDLHGSVKIEVLRDEELVLLLIEDRALPGRVGLHQRAVAAEKVVCLACPALFGAGGQRQEIGQQALVRAVIVLAVRFEALPVGLRQKTVVNAELEVIGVFRVFCPAEEVFRQAQHVIDGAVLLVFVAEARAKRLNGGPNLAARLPAGGIGAALVHSKLPVSLHNVAPVLLARDLIGTRAAQHLRDRRVCVHVGEHILAFQQRGEEAPAVVALEQDTVFFVSRERQKLRPDLEHAARLKVENIVHLFACELGRPVIEPVGKAIRHIQRLTAACELGHVHQAHQRLVQVVMRRPHLLAAGNPVQIFFRNGPHPAAAVFLLAQRQLMHNGVRLGLYLDVARGVDVHGRRGKPVAQKMPAKLAGLRFPAAVNAIRVEGRRVSSRLQVEVQEQVFRFQIHHVLAVPCLAAQEFFLPQLHAGAPNVLQHCKLLLCVAALPPFYTKKKASDK